jgi:hypothetical protein
VGANGTVQLEGAERSGGQLNLMRGDDASRWHTGIPLYKALNYRGLYAGIDLRYDGQTGQLKGTYSVAPHADAGVIRWRYAGAERVSLTSRGDLQITLSGGRTLIEQAPIAWQDIDGLRQPIEARFDLRGSEVGFSLGAYDQNRPLVIDPTLVFSTYAGGSGFDYARNIAIDGQGNIYIVGDTLSSNFLNLSYTPKGSNDVVVLKLNPTASSILYATILGGNNVDKGTAIAVNSAGQVYITVDADSTNFPIQNAWTSTKPDGNDAALVKLNANGTLASSTWLTINTSTYAGRHLALDSQGNVIVTGEQYDIVNFRSDLVVLKFNPQVTALTWGLVWSDDHKPDSGTAVAIGPSDAIYVTGYTEGWNDDFGVTANALQALCGRQRALGTGVSCDQDGVVIILNANGTEQYVSYWGGHGSDLGQGIAVNTDGSFVVTGNTDAPDFSTTNGALQPACQIEQSTSFCYYDTFVTRFTPNASAVAWSTYLASDEVNVHDFSSAVAIGAQGNVYALGYTAGESFPLLNPLQNGLMLGNCSAGLFTRFCFDVTLTVFNPSGGLVFSTYFGGLGDEYSQGLAVDTQGNAYFTGYSDSLAYPTTSGTIQPAKKPGAEFFITKINVGGGGSPIDLPNKVYLPLLKR